jgi:two-component system, sensor histidine kinase and response regulator
MVDESLKNANILIIDDQIANIEVLTGLLAVQGYCNFKTTTDPRNVVELMAEFNPDLVLLDLAMPYFSGFEILEQIKSLISKDSYLPILILTADISTESKRKALAEGATDFLTKPFDLVEVGLRIKNLLFSRYLHQQLTSQNQQLEDQVAVRTKQYEEAIRNLELANEKTHGSDALKTIFVNNVSHDIRTPLNAIVGFSKLLLSDNLAAGQRNEYIDIIKNSSDRLLHTIDKFMDISMLQSGTLSLVADNYSLLDIIRDAIQEPQRWCANKKLEFKFEPAANLEDIVINTDKELLMKVFRHLFDNAVKFTNNGYIQLSVDVILKKVLFEIKDTGMGFSKEFEHQIFQMFNQINDKHKGITVDGMGLGLSIVKGAIDMLQGKLWFNSEPGNGTSFYFSLPLNPESAINASLDTNKSILNSKPTILLVEDDELNYHYFETILKQCNVQIIRVSDGYEAVKKCQSNHQIKLVVMDLKLPLMSGFEATMLIKSFKPKLPIFAVTAHTGLDEKRRAIEAGCSEFLVKPVNKTVLLDKLKAYNIIDDCNQ